MFIQRFFCVNYFQIENNTLGLKEFRIQNVESMVLSKQNVRF